MNKQIIKKMIRESIKEVIKRSQTESTEYGIALDVVNFVQSEILKTLTKQNPDNEVISNEKIAVMTSMAVFLKLRMEVLDKLPPVISRGVITHMVSISQSRYMNLVCSQLISKIVNGS